MMQLEPFFVLDCMVGWVPGGVAWSLSVELFCARWGGLVVLTEDRLGRRCARLGWRLAHECKRCVGLDRCVG